MFIYIFLFCNFSDDGTPWSPKPHDKICSAHFIGGKKSEERLSPSYVPTIFPTIYRKKKINESQVLARYNRFIAPRTTQISKCTTSTQVIKEVEDEFIQQPQLITDKGCQANVFSELILNETTFTCNRYIYNDHCDAEIQVDIASDSRVISTNTSKKMDRSCCTDQKKFKDQSISTNGTEFFGILSIKEDQQLLDLAGVTFKNFEFLLTRLENTKGRISLKNHLLIFLMKMKTGLTFSALSVLFGVHRTTVSRLFYSMLDNLTSATAKLVFWPHKAAVQATMPECFSPDYSSTRVIIDCTEFRIEVPPAVDDRVVCYSHYKKGFTAKVIIGITPGGFICFKSKVAGGRKTDSQMTVESGLLDLLEAGDVVLADKGFPEIKKVLDDSGREVKIVMPPFLTNKSEFSKEQTQNTYEIARVRIHVERIMQRLRVYRVLDKIPHNLFSHIDDFF